MKFYFVVSGRSNETEMNVVKKLKPKYLMLSYHYFKNVDLGEFKKFLGYEPIILGDSGAWSAFNKGAVVKLDKYCEWIEKNEKHLSRYICLDKVGDNDASIEMYYEMKSRGLKPVPVFHYMGDESILEKYIAEGEKFICLGGTVPIKNKNAVAEWVRMLAWSYPEVRFHLLGSGSKKILDHCDIESADAATWIIGAVNGKPKHIEGKDQKAKEKRALWNMSEHMKKYDS